MTRSSKPYTTHRLKGDGSVAAASPPRDPASFNEGPHGHQPIEFEPCDEWESPRAGLGQARFGTPPPACISAVLPRTVDKPTSGGAIRPQAGPPILRQAGPPILRRARHSMSAGRTMIWTTESSRTPAFINVLGLGFRFQGVGL